jgi:RNA polymerase sigma-70 factor (ECF subfamily)
MPAQTLRSLPAGEADDVALLAAYLRGDTSAFETLVRRHGADLKGFALRMLGSKEAAEDVFVESFSRLAVVATRWRAGGTVRGFLFTTARRLCLDERRRQRSHRGAMLAYSDMPPIAARPGPEALAVLGELASALEEAIASLPAPHREVLLLRLVHGFDGRETADMLGVSEEQVRSMLSYARRLARESLGQQVAARSSA